MKILDVDGFQKGIKEIEETLSSQKKQAEQIEKSIQGVTDLDEAFKGKGGNAIRDFYRSKHLPLLEQYQTFLSDYQAVIKQMNDALQNLEPAPDGFMNEGFLENELQAGLHFAKQTTVHLTFEANETIKSVSDIVTLPRIEDETCMQYVAKAEREMSHSIEKVYEFDHAQTSSLSSLQGQVDALEKQIMQLSLVFQKSNFDPVLLPTKKFESKKVEDIASELSEFKINPHNPADSAAILEGGLLALTDIVIDLVDTLYYMVSDPFGFAQGMFNAVIHLDETIKYLWNDVKQSFEEEFIHGDQRSRVRFISYSGVYIAASIYGVKGTEKVGTVSKAGRISNASKKGTKQNIPYNVMNTTAIKAAAHDGIKNFFDLSKDANRQLHSSEIGKIAKEVNSYSAKINDTIGKSKNVLNSEKFSTKMEKTYQKVVSGPVSKAVNSEAYSTFEKLVMNENGSVRFTGIPGDSKKGTKGEGNVKHFNDVPRIKEVEVNFKRNDKHDSAEFARQLKDQEKAMNELTVDEYLKNREKYIEQGRAIEGNAAQQAAREEAYVQKINELQREGLTLSKAKKQAKEWLDTQAALHNPDQIAGGKAEVIGGLGDKRINSSIGSQWRYRIDIVDEQIKELAKSMTPEQLKNTYLNVRLTH
jgi:LXG domain of WXG superfamily/Novel toxin 15